MAEREDVSVPAEPGTSGAADPGTPGASGAAGDIVQCDITGEQLPFEETVVLHGYRVGPAGKQALLQRLQAGESLPGEMVRPTVLRRFACLFLDAILIYAVSLGIMLPLFVLAGVGAGAMFTDEYANVTEMLVSALAMLAVTTVGVLYFTLMHGYFGKTLGKMAGHVKVVRDDGGPITTTQAFWRAMLYTGVNYLPALALCMAVFNAVVAEATSMALNLAVSVFVLINVIFALVDRQQQRALHDRLTGVRVIRTD